MQFYLLIYFNIPLKTVNGGGIFFHFMLNFLLFFHLIR